MTRPYVFVDEWRLAADPDDVWPVVRDVGNWPAWWPSARSVSRLPDAAAERWAFRFTTRLPYSMGFDVLVLADDPRTGVDNEVTGKLEGRGRWHAEAVPGGTLVRFDWSVTPTPRWMRLLSPLARPIFRWNHSAIMIEGGQALAQRLGVPLLAETVSRLEP